MTMQSIFFFFATAAFMTYILKEGIIGFYSTVSLAIFIAAYVQILKGEKNGRK